MRKVIDFINDIRKTDKGKALLFFVFFFFFFLFLGMFSRANMNTPKKEINVNYTPEVNIDKLLDNNFEYTYTIELDNKKSVYTGKINENVEEFTFDDGVKSTKYYRDGDNYLIFEDLWIKGEKPTDYYDFFNTKKIKKIIDNSTYDSKTDFKSGKVIYKLLVSSNTINKIIDKKDTDFDEVPNEITISFDENSDVEYINLSLDSYCKNNEICNDRMNIKLEYSSIGKVGVIDSPLDE